MFSLRSVLFLCLAATSTAFLVAPSAPSRAAMTTTAIRVAVDPTDVPLEGGEEEEFVIPTELEAAAPSSTIEEETTTKKPLVPTTMSVQSVDTEKIMEQAKEKFGDLKTKVANYVESDEFQDLSSKAVEFAKDVSGQIFKAVGEGIKEFNEANKKPATEEEEMTTKTK